MAAPFEHSVDSVVVVIGAGAGGGVLEAAAFVLVNANQGIQPFQIQFVDQVGKF